MGQHSKPRTYAAQHRKPKATGTAVAGFGTVAAGAAIAGTIILPSSAASAAVITPAQAASLQSAGAHPEAPELLTPTAVAAPAVLTVRQGDTLTSLAQSHCGSAAKWPGLFKANASAVTNPNLIYPGQKLRRVCDDTPAPVLAADVTLQAPVQHTYTHTHTQPVTHPVTDAVSAGEGSSSAYGAFPGASCIVERESGGNPTAQNPGSTASGLFQDLDSTWADYDGYARAMDAPASVQIEFNQKLASGGLSPWAADGCPGT